MNRFEAPRYEIESVFDNGESAGLEILPVTRPPWEAGMSRRGCLGTGLTLAATAALILGAHGEAAALDGEEDEGGEDGGPASGSRGEGLGDGSAPRAHRHRITSLHFTRGDELLISGSLDGTAKAWSIPSGVRRSTMKVRGDSPVYAVGAQADGNVAGAASVDGNIKLWSPNDGRIMGAQRLEADENTLMVYSNGFIAGRGACKLLPEPIEGQPGLRTATLLSPDQKKIVAARPGGVIEIWSRADGKLLVSITADIGTANALAMTPDGKVVVSLSPDRAIRLWSAIDGSPIDTVPPDAAEKLSVAVADEGRTLIVGCGGGLIRFWSGGVWRERKEHDKGVTALAVTADGSLLAAGYSDGVLLLLDLSGDAPANHLFDAETNPPATRAFTYNVTDALTGRTYSYTLPCGSPIPPGATCTCNCVPGSYGRSVPVPRKSYTPKKSAPRSSGGGVTGTVCTCNKICTCIPICQAHRLLDADRTIRSMAETAVAAMGPEHLAYLRWAADRARGRLAAHIREMTRRIESGGRPAPPPRFDPDELPRLLWGADAMAALLAAQTISRIPGGFASLQPEARARIQTLLAEARRVSASLPPNRRNGGYRWTVQVPAR